MTHYNDNPYDNSLNIANDFFICSLNRQWEDPHMWHTDSNWGFIVRPLGFPAMVPVVKPQGFRWRPLGHQVDSQVLNLRTMGINKWGTL